MTPSPHKAAGNEPWKAAGFTLATPVAAALISAVAATGLIVVASFASLIDAESEGAALSVIAIWIALALGTFFIAAPLLALGLTRLSSVRGRGRFALGALYSMWLPATLIGGGSAVWFGYGAGLEYVGIALGLLIAGSCIASTMSLAAGRPLRWIWLGLAAAVAVFVIGVDWREPAFRQSIYTDAALPLGLVDEAALQRALPGWQVGRYEDSPRDGTWPYAYVVVETTSGAEVTLTFHPDGLLCPESTRGTCRQLSALSDGTTATLWSDNAQCGTPSQPPYVLVEVARGQGRWEAVSHSRCRAPAAPTVEELRLLVDAVRPVSVAEWVEAT